MFVDCSDQAFKEVLLQLSLTLLELNLVLPRPEDIELNLEHRL